MPYKVEVLAFMAHEDVKDALVLFLLRLLGCPSLLLTVIQYHKLLLSIERLRNEKIVRM